MNNLSRITNISSSCIDNLFSNINETNLHNKLTTDLHVAEHLAQIITRTNIFHAEVSETKSVL